MDIYANITVFLILILIIIYKTAVPKKYNNNESILDYNKSIIFEIIELIFIITLIIYCIFNKYIINCLMLCIAFIEHLLQLYHCYRQKGGSLKNLITGLIYIILIIYNTIKQNYIFIIVWIVGLLIHIISYLSKKSFVKILCFN